MPAGLAHPVERLLPKQKVASSSLVTRSTVSARTYVLALFFFWALRCCLREDRSCGRCARGCFGERVTNSDGCGQNRHEKTTVRRHRGDPSRFKAALFFRRGNFLGRELPEFDRLSFPSFLPFQPGTFTFSGHLTLAAIPLSSGLHSTLHGNAGSVLLLPLPLLTIIRKCTTLRSLPARKYAFGCVAAC